jgi:hypothetical protein
MDHEKLVDKIYVAMRLLSELSENAKSIGDNSLMYAANRAWQELYNQQKTAGQASPERCRGYYRCEPDEGSFLAAPALRRSFDQAGCPKH